MPRIHIHRRVVPNSHIQQNNISSSFVVYRHEEADRCINHEKAEDPSKSYHKGLRMFAKDSRNDNKLIKVKL